MHKTSENILLSLLNDSDKSRYWRYVQKRESCWTWEGYKDQDGYGIFVKSDKGKQSRIRTHRLAYWLSRGILPPDKVVCHTCDIPACCNPEHLFVATHRENQLDKFGKNRQAKGESHGCAKLTEEQVLFMRRMYKEWNTSAAELSRLFNVSKNTAERIVNAVSWKHLTEEQCQKYIR